MILKSQLNVSESCDLSERIITRDLTKCQPPRSQKYQKPLINTLQVVDNNSQTFYNTSINVGAFLCRYLHSGSISIE